MQSSNPAPAPASETPTILTTIWNFFTPAAAPEKPAEIVIKKPEKKRRVKATLDANQTASIGLSDEQKKDDCYKIKNTSNTTSYVTSAYNTVMSLFNKVPAPNSFQPSAEPEKKSVNDKMIALQKMKEVQIDDAKIDEICLQQVELVEMEIIEHAARRVDIFFHLLLAVYEKNVHVTKGVTTKQHGTGSDVAGTQACHSSMFPNIEMALKDVTKPWFGAAPSCPSLTGTHLAEVMNMTVELPGVVNDFDGHLEGRSHPSNPTKFTSKCLDILNYVSDGTYDPQRGMTEFIKTLTDFFTRFEDKYITKNKATYPKAMEKVLELQREGTYRLISDDRMTINKSYISSQLRINTWTESLKAAPSFYAFYKSRQEEIYNSKTVAADTIERKKQERERIKAEKAKKLLEKNQPPRPK